jgi:hypothetical protein
VEMLFGIVKVRGVQRGRCQTRNLFIVICEVLFPGCRAGVGKVVLWRT